ncbi:MAG TPA: TonB family protein [Verrucomicrobiae bacterium]|jgi:protein TonB
MSATSNPTALGAPPVESTEHRLVFAEDQEDPLRTTLTFAILVVCVATGIAGILRPNPDLVRIKRQVEAKVDLIQVDVVKQPEPPPPENLPPPEMKLPDNAPVIAVAAPTAPVAFALPVDGLVQIVEARYAAAAAPVAQTTNVVVVRPQLPAPQRISSPGTGNNPLPVLHYPGIAQRKHQTGSVTVHVLIDTQGKVTGIKLVKPTRYTELNEGIDYEANASWVGKTYFPPGPERILEFPIDFILQ